MKFNISILLVIFWTGFFAESARSQEKINYVSIATHFDGIEPSESAFFAVMHKAFVDDTNNHQLALEVYRVIQGYDTINSNNLSFDEKKEKIEEYYLKRKSSLDERYERLNKEYKDKLRNFENKEYELERAKSEYDRCANFTSLHGRSCNSETKRYNSKVDSYNAELNRFKRYEKNYNNEINIIKRDAEKIEQDTKEFARKLEKQVKSRDPLDEYLDAKNEYDEDESINKTSWLEVARGFVTGSEQTSINSYVTKDLLTFYANRGSKKAVRMMNELSLTYNDSGSIVVKDFQKIKEVSDLSKKYYNEQSDFAGVYVLNRILDSAVADDGDLIYVYLKYEYKAINGSEKGVDMRAFTFERTSDGQYEPYYMGDHMSAKDFF